MEKQKNANRNYRGATDNPALRLPKPPSQTRPFGDDAMSAPTKFSQPSQSKRSQTAVMSEEDEDSDDPLDSLSETSPKKTRKANMHRPVPPNPKDYAAKARNLKNLKFKKTKATEGVGDINERARNDERGTTSQSKVSSNDGDMFASPPRPPPPRPRPQRKAAPAPFPLGTNSSSSSLPTSRYDNHDDDLSDRWQVQPFPVSPPRTSSVTPPSERGARKKGAMKPRDFPMDLSPEVTKKPRKPEAFPMLVEPNTRKPSRMVVRSESEDEWDDNPPRTQPWNPPKKRLSAGDDPSPRKKTRPGDTSLIDEHAPVEESFFETVDPNTLCPYCDNSLPSSPSPTLRTLLDTMAKKSYPDPRPTNVLGRKAPFSTFISVCQRHRFESDILPEAKSKGWPSAIDWKKLAGRIEKLKPKLQLLIDDDSDDGPRARSSAWNEIMELVKEKGSRAATGVKDQFLNFEKIQPGYYGELGSIIIHQTLYDLFPATSIDVKSIAPLGAEEFLQRVLIPEVALRLVMEDQRLKGGSGRREALKILRDSSVYGVAMFPAEQVAEGKYSSGKPGGPSSTRGSGMHGNTKEGLNAGESIVMERARKRRKEIEEEEAREKEEEDSATRMGVDSTMTGVAPRPRPKPVVRGPSNGSLMEVDMNAMSSKSDAENGRDEMRYDTESADGGFSGSETGRRQGKARQVAQSQASSKTRSSSRSKSARPHPSLFSESSDSTADESDTREKKARGAKSKPAPFPLSRDRESSFSKGSNRSRPETDTLEIEDEEESFATKTPKPKPFPLMVDDAPTPRSNQAGPRPVAPRSDAVSESIPPLLRARLQARARGKASASTAVQTDRKPPTTRPTHLDSPTQKGGGIWLHSMREEYTQDSDDSDSSMDSVSSNRHHQKSGQQRLSRTAGKTKATAAPRSLGRSKQHVSPGDNDDDPTNWLFSDASSQESAQNGKTRGSQASKRRG